MISSDYHRERAIVVIEREHGVTITRAGGCSPGRADGGGSSVTFAVTASGLIEIARAAEMAEALRFEGVARDYSTQF